MYIQWHADVHLYMYMYTCVATLCMLRHTPFQKQVHMYVRCVSATSHVLHVYMHRNKAKHIHVVSLLRY